MKCGVLGTLGFRGAVAPFTGAWVEIRDTDAPQLSHTVAPFTGAWVEIAVGAGGNESRRSHPSRVRGLKYLVTGRHLARELEVAPFTGAWVEIPLQAWHYQPDRVAPFTGAWVEIPELP